MLKTALGLTQINDKENVTLPAEMRLAGFSCRDSDRERAFFQARGKPQLIPVQSRTRLTCS